MRAAIALGANVGERLPTLQRAWEACRRLSGAGAPFLASALYETAPVGMPPGAAPFLNAVGELSWAGSPEALLAALRAIEQTLGRPAERPRHASRTVDLDLLYHGETVRRTPELTLPHPRLGERRFVLAPLAELAPGLRLPGFRQTVAELLAALPAHGPAVHRLPDSSRL